jgi:Spy/CpxP family protein refolding chaperone
VRRLLILALGALVFAGSVSAADLPPGKWWRRPEIIQQLQLSEDQQTRLDGIFRTSADDLIDLRGGVEKANVALRSELDQPQLDRQKIRALATRLSELRGRLFDRELMMLVDMRAVLSDSQWNRMRQVLDRVGGQGNGQRMQPQRVPRNQRQ